MLVIEDGMISLTRGDTAYFNVSIVVGKDEEGEDIEYEYQEGDTLTLSCRTGYGDEDGYVFQKIVPANQTLVIEPFDTRELSYGKYVYDIQLDTAVGEVFTLQVGIFKITKEVTLYDKPSSDQD